MNQSESNFYRWLLNNEEIDPDSMEYQSRGTPDFIGKEKGWEVKKLYRNSIVLHSDKQADYVRREDKNTYIVIMPENPNDDSEPLFIIPCSALSLDESPRFSELEEYSVREDLPSKFRYRNLKIKRAYGKKKSMTIWLEEDTIEKLEKLREEKIISSIGHGVRRALNMWLDEMETRGEPFG